MSRSRAAIERARLLASNGGTLANLLDRLAVVYGDRRLVEEADGIALAGGATTLTYREAAELVGRASVVVQGKVSSGRPVVVQGANGFSFMLACLAVSRAGGVFVPINPQMREEEVAHVLADAGGELLELDWLCDQLARIRMTAPPPPASVRPEEVAAILYTSGTTGKPKGALLTHRGLLEQPSRVLALPTVRRRDEMVMALPVAHIMGFSVLLSTAFAGTSTFVLPRFRPTDVLDVVERRRSTAFAGVPAMYRMMLDAGAETRDLRSIRLWLSAADVMPEELARRFKKMGATGTIPLVDLPFGEATFAEGYGMVELAGLVAAKLSLPFPTPNLGGFLGFPLPPYRVRILDDEGQEAPDGEVGELSIHGPGVLRGYHGNSEATRAVRSEDGWLKTGDLARKNRFGLIQFVGRKKEVIKHGGYSVFPAEIEEVLREHPAVADAAAIGRPDPVKGEIPLAFVELTPGSSITGPELMGWVAGRLADYKLPKEIRVLEALPRTGTGKVAKAQLKSLAGHA